MWRGSVAVSANAADLSIVMPRTRVRPPAGPSTGLVPGIHVLGLASKTWMAGTSPAMT